MSGCIMQLKVGATARVELAVCSAESNIGVEQGRYARGEGGVGSKAVVKVGSRALRISH